MFNRWCRCFRGWERGRRTFRFNRSTGYVDLFAAPAAGNGPDGRSRLWNFRNAGVGSDPQFVLEDSLYGPPLPFEPAPVFGDPDGDGDDDLLVGTSKGGLVYYRLDGATAVEREEAPLPAGFRLGQNYPNPFNASTVISFDLPEPADVRAELFDVHGRRVSLLAEGRRRAGPGLIQTAVGT